MESELNMALTFEEFKSSGITKNTPKNMVFGAGTIHKGLKFLLSFIFRSILSICV